MDWLLPDPLTRTIAQIVVIVSAARLLGVVARRLRQPMVIAEVVAGILLGPSLLGWLLPEVSAALFPPQSLGALHIMSQLGLVLFMFLVGMELDVGLLRARGHVALIISNCSIAVPFLLGALAAAYLHPRFSEPGVALTAFALFMGAAMSITAFPVLARILTEGGLSRTRVGAMSLACAAINDVTAWCILAFVVAAVRAEGFGAALRTVVLSLAYVAAMFAVVRPMIVRMAARIGSRESLSHNAVAALVVVAFLSSWATEVIGIHALFGAFLFGAILPKAGDFPRQLAARIEDLVVVILLPLFFAYSGLQTQVGLLSSAGDWLACALILAVACLGKFGGSIVPARLMGLSWREAGALGVLMNTRGLMELVVLNIGLDLGVISPAIFTMMVIMALATTFMTTPILRAVYAPGELMGDLELQREVAARTLGRDP
jgi:Kef-type K+ transport system membrane component KefB